MFDRQAGKSRRKEMPTRPTRTAQKSAAAGAAAATTEELPRVEAHELREEIAAVATQLGRLLERVEEEAAARAEFEQTLRMKVERSDARQQKTLDIIAENIIELAAAVSRPRKKRATAPQPRAYTLDELRERWNARRSDDPSIMSAQLKLMDIDEVSTVASGA